MKVSFKVAFVLMFCSTVAASAQSKSHLKGKMSPELMAQLRAEFESFEKENGIDNSTGPSTYSTNAYFLEQAHNNTEMLNVLNTIVRKPELLQHLELIGDQENKIHQIVDEYRELLIELKREIAKHPAASHASLRYDFDQEAVKLTQRLADALVAFQTFELMDATLDGKGLLKALTQPTMAAKYVNLSDQQKRRIKEKQTELGKEVIEFIRQKRRESSLIFENELDQGQKERVVEFFGAEKISQLFEGAHSTSLINQAGLNPHKDEAVGPQLKAWRKIEKINRDR